ncbi:MAG: DUF169 domain-containing protein [Negativicutes bacterium]|nr:DUF169 domain-containing protein [Negativicutes bacterium]
MNSEIAARLKLRYSPVAILFGGEKPAGAMEFVAGRRGCVAAMLSAAAKGRQAVFSRGNCGCAGGMVGLGFGDSHGKFPGGFDYFLSTGRGEGYPEGEGYKKTPELVKTFTDVLPYTDIPFEYVIFKPLTELDQAEEPKLIVFYANPDQLSALVVLANYGREGNDNVIIPFGAGCHSFCLIPWHEAGQQRPRAVVGMTDITARPFIDADLLAFSVPYAMFREMEDNVSGSFLDKPDWQKVAGRIPAR